ncbi:MAG: glycoside hydrolase family 2 protein [Candidatus Acidiferrales bacterium]
MSRLTRCFYRAVFVALFIFVVPSKVNAQATSRILEAKWEFRAVSNTDNAQLKEWHPAEVPGVVQTDLLHDGLIPDPFYQDNDTRLQWIGLTDWEYRTTFDADAATLGHDHVDLVFDGLDTYADVYVNEQPVLHSDNMFRRWRVPAKTLLKVGPNTLRIVFHSPIESMIPKVKALPYILPSVTSHMTGNEEDIATAPYTRKAPYQYGWDWGPRYVTEGIWKPIRLETWDALRIENFHIQQQSVTKDFAALSAEVEIEASHSAAASIEINYAELSGAPSAPIRQSVQLEPGVNRISVAVHIANPKLWYPLGVGAQDRYRFSAQVRIGRNVAADASLKTGLRSIELRREVTGNDTSFAFVVNGIPIFAKGADVIPFDSFPNRVTPEIHRQILEAARDAHMNMVREWGGGYYESDDFYDICDELGIMVWQEFIFGGDMVPGGRDFQDNVKQEAIEQVERLRDHPSIVLWCGNNEIETGWVHWDDRKLFKESVSPADREKVWQDYVVLFHGILAGVVARYANPVPYWASSPSANFEAPPDSQNNGDMHYWQVWHQLAPIEMYTQQFPRFMSEYGFQSFPEMRTIRSFAQPGDMDIHSVTMQDHQKNHGGNERILSYMLRWYPEPKDFPSFVYLSQVLQAEAIKVGAEHLRRQRPNTMGSLYWQLNDCWPVASWASIDYYGRWKALQYYARRFYDDVIVSPFAHDGKVDVYVVSDKLQPLTGQVHTRLLDFSGKVLSDKTQDVQVPAQSSAVYFTLDEKDLLANADPKKSFLVFDLMVGGAEVSRNLIFFDTMHNLDLPTAVHIDTSLDNSNGGYAVTLHSPVLARSVYISFGDLDVQTSDNYFDLLPGETVTVKLKAPSTVSLDQLKSAMQVISLTDAFPAAATMH